jgi:hypothetical protein
MSNNETFQSALRNLYDRCGRPSLREIQAATDNRISRSHISHILHGGVGSWEKTSAIIVALGGDPATFRNLWDQYHLPRTGIRTRPLSGSSGGHDELVAALDRLTEAVHRLVAKIP